MARRDEQARTTRVDVPGIGQSAGNAPQLQVNRRNFSAILGGHKDSQRKAQALIDAVGAGVTLYNDVGERRNKKFNLLGQQAAIEGRELTPEEQERDAFMVGYQEIQDDRATIEIKAEALKRYNEMDTSNMDAAGIAKLVDDIFQEQYEGIDVEDGLDRVSMERMLPRIQAIQEELIVNHKGQMQQAVQDDVDMSVGIAIQHELDTTGSLNMDQWNRKIVQIYGKKRANDEMVEIVTGIAIREGRPELIEKLTEKKAWENGAPTPGGIRRYDQKLHNAKLQAENQKARNEADDENASLKVTKAENEQFYAEVTLKVLSGESAERAIIEGLEAGKLTGPQAQALTRFVKGYADSATAGDPDYDAVWKYREKYLKDTTNLEEAEEELLELASSGALGDAESRRVIVEQELAVIQRRRAARLSDPTYQVEETELKGEYAVSQATWNTDPRYRKAQNNAVIRMAELVLEGESADEAREKALQEFPVPSIEGANALTRAINKIEENPALEPTLITTRQAGESLPDFINRIETALGRQLSTSTLEQWQKQGHK